MRVANCERFNSVEKWERVRSEVCRILQTRRTGENERICDNNYCNFFRKDVENENK